MGTVPCGFLWLFFEVLLYALCESSTRFRIGLQRGLIRFCKDVFRLVLIKTRSSADADNSLDAFSGQSRSTNMVPFHM